MGSWTRVASRLSKPRNFCQHQWKSSPPHHLWILFVPCSANIGNDWSKKQTWTNQLTSSRYCLPNHAESNTRWWHLKIFLLLSSFMSGLHILLFPHCTSVRSQHYTDNLISTRKCSCVCICWIALCLFMYSAVMRTCSCLVDVMWTCAEVGWPFGLEERDVPAFVPKACCAFCRLPVLY
jgi:hypothetical protein